MIFNKFKYIVAVMSIIALPAAAEIISVDVNGRGVSYREAVLDGLRQGLEQVSGITLSADELVSINQITNDVNENSKDYTKHEVSQAMQKEIKSRANGYISSYNVSSSDKNDDGLFVISMTVNVEKYIAPGSNNNRRGMAIMGITSEPGRCYGHHLSPKDIQHDFEMALVSSFTNTRKFSVLDRDEKKVYDLEKSLLASDDAAQREMIKLGNVKGTDYILTGKVKKLTVWDDVNHIDLTGEDIHNRGAEVLIDYKVIVFATRQVKVSSTIKVNLNEKELADKGCMDITKLILDKAALKIATECIENIYPPLIIQVSGDQILMNMGGNNIKKGNHYGIYSIGNSLVDPYTGESLGFEEKKIGTMEIVDVKPKYSIGKLVDGTIADVQVNQICRQENAPIQTKKATSTKPTPKQNYSLDLD